MVRKGGVVGKKGGMGKEGREREEEEGMKGEGNGREEKKCWDNQRDCCQSGTLVFMFIF